MAYFLYRLNGGYVESASTSAISGYDAAIFAVANNPTAVDGEDIGVRKVFDGSVVRNSTGTENSNYTIKVSEDSVAAGKEASKAGLDLMPLVRGTLDSIRKEINVLRSLHGLSDHDLEHYVSDGKNSIDAGV